ACFHRYGHFNLTFFTFIIPFFICSAKRFDGDHNFTKLGLPSAAIFLNSVSAKRFAVGVENEKRCITKF
ncbi:hypothetical protein OZ701_003785, partial [Yersinia enterocolitica]